MITDLDRWVTRKHGHMDYYLTQKFSGHGCFGKYLLRIGKATTAECEYCGVSKDSACHTLFECRARNRERETLHELTDTLEHSSNVRKMVESKNVWNAVAHFARKILRAKEDAERV